MQELRQLKIVDCVRAIQRAWRAVRGRTFYKKLIYYACELVYDKVCPHAHMHAQIGIKHTHICMHK